MFVQLIEAKVADADGFARQLDRWQAELRPGATGFLGSTAGITDDGRAVIMARFESTDAAQANSDRPEQGAWWRDLEATFDGSARFAESTEIDMLLGGGSDDAGFVQVMKAIGADRDRLRAIDGVLESLAESLRPDLLGGYRIWTGADTCVQAAYFTSEDDARAGERKDLPTKVTEQISELQAAMGDVEYLDLRRLLIA